MLKLNCTAIYIWCKISWGGGEISLCPSGGALIWTISLSPTCKINEDNVRDVKAIKGGDTNAQGQTMKCRSTFQEQEANSKI